MSREEILRKIDKAFDDLEIDSEPGMGGGWIDSGSQQNFKEKILEAIDEDVRHEAIEFQNWFENNVRDKMIADENDYSLWEQTKKK